MTLMPYFSKGITISKQGGKEEIYFPAETCNTQYFKILQIIKSISNYGSCTYIDNMIIKGLKIIMMVYSES